MPSAKKYKITRAFADDVRKHRKDNGLRLEDLAKIIDTSRSQISRIENAEGMIPIEMVEALEAYFGTSLGGTTNKKDVENLRNALREVEKENNQLKKLIAEIIKEYRDENRELKRLIEEMKKE